MISVVLPVVRPDQANIVIELIHERAGINNVDIHTAYDEDRIGCPKMVKRLVETTKYDLVCFIGDDCIPQQDFLLNAYNCMQENDLYLVGLNDGTGRVNLPTHWLANKKLLAHCENREFFYTGYKHCYCDLELKDKAESIGKFKYCYEAIVLHNHPALKDETTEDPDYIRVYSKEIKWHDMSLYHSRKMGVPVIAVEINCPNCQKGIEVVIPK